MSRGDQIRANLTRRWSAELHARISDADGVEVRRWTTWRSAAIMKDSFPDNQSRGCGGNCGWILKIHLKCSSGTLWWASAEAGAQTQLHVFLPLCRFCVGDKFFLKNNMILCQLDYEGGHLNGSAERPPQWEVIRRRHARTAAPTLTVGTSTVSCLTAEFWELS